MLQTEEITTEENTPRKVEKRTRDDMASPGSDSTSPVHKAYIGENEEGNAVARVSSESNAVRVQSKTNEARQSKSTYSKHSHRQICQVTATQ